MPAPIGSNPRPLDPSRGTQPRITTPAQAYARIPQMSVQEKAKLLVMNYGDTHVAPWSGSVIVNQTHLTATGTKQLAQANQTAAGRTGATVIVAADQEGGRVNRMKNVPGYENVTFPSPQAMRSMTPAQLKAEGAKVGAALKAAGVNMLLGPVLDAASPGTLMDKQGRSFGATPAEVLARAQPFIDGLKEANPNVVLIAKHFPGYDVRGNSDISKQDDNSTLDELRAKAAPFTQMKGLDGVMINSVRYPNVDGNPACFSTTIINLLRDKNPGALVITDDIAAGGLLSDKSAAFKNYEVSASRTDPASKADAARLLSKYPDFGTSEGRGAVRATIHQEIKANAKKAFLAGCDVVLTMDSREAPGVADAIAELMTERPDMKPRLDQAAARMMLASIKATPGAEQSLVATAPAPSRGWTPPS
jgi:beta-glucosidase-like glycosyl hydrolase